MKVSSDTNSSIIKSTSYNWPVLTLSVFSIFGILGNILVCLTIKRDQDLQTKTNFYLFSLAFADLAVCLIINGFLISSFFKDILLCTASIYHLSTLSILRFIAIQYPLKSNRTTSYKITFFIIFLIWAVSILLSSLIIYLGYTDVRNVINFETRRCMLKNDKFIIYGSIICFVIPIFIMILMFLLMTRKLRQQISKLNKKDKKNREENKTEFRKKTKEFRLQPSSRQIKKFSRSFDQSPIFSARSLSTRNEKDFCSINTKRCHCVIQNYDVNQQKPGYKDYQLRRHAARSVMQSPSFKTSIGSIMSNQTSNLSQNSFQKQLTIESYTNKKKKRDSMYKGSIFFKNYEIKNVILSHIKQMDMQNEFKALQVLGIVFIAFLIAWLPYCLVNIIIAIYSINKKSTAYLQNFLGFLTYLGYFQSTFNPIIYTIFNRKFRNNFIQLLKCAKRNHRPNNYFISKNLIYYRN
ncbi:D(2) dopamine receptor A [Brachionus plicatilis]|uniref:D(2) dopamine receptor A n=1 Tax=Brachionus plicatilis TaxID=10195 RepID=A0A3M7P713_BRAPC|nr:D(2) dopamine receptor A [Brachionus plicatilis]